MTEQVFDHMKWMLDLCTRARPEILKLFGHTAQLVLRQRLALGALHGHMPDHRFADVLGPLFDALMASVAKGCDLTAASTY